MNLHLIKKFVEEKNYSGGIKGLAEAIGMTEQNLHRCVRTNKIQAQDLEKIAGKLNVSIMEFFDEGNGGMRTAGRDYVEKGRIIHHGPENTSHDAKEIETLRKENENLRRSLIDAQAKIIHLMEQKTL